MLRRIVETSLQFRFLVLVAAFAVIFFGSNRLRTMPVDAFPEFAPPHVEVQTEALGLSAGEVEDLLTLNIEELLNGVAFLKNIRSRSVPGMSSVMLTFEPGTDLMQARQMVQERLTLAYALPNVSTPPVMLQPMSANRRAMMIGLSSEEVSPISLSVLARWTIKPKLMGVPGVSNINIWGQRKRQLQVQIDPERLKKFGVTQDQIIRTAGDALWVSPLSFLNASMPGTGGWIDTPNQRIAIRHILPISKPEELANVTIRASKDGNGKALTLGDVTTVVEQHPPLIGDAIIGDGDGLLLVVEKLPGANTQAVTRGIEAALDSLRPGLPGVKIDASIYSASNYVETAIGNVSGVALIGMGLLALVLFAFLYNWRSGLIALIAVPLTILTAALVLQLRGETMNMMVLAGLAIAIGIIIDDAISTSENIMRRLREAREAKSEQPTLSIIVDATTESSYVFIYALLIVALAIAPLFFMGGVGGAFFEPMAVSYLLALLASMVVAAAFVPAMASLLFSGEASQKSTESPFIGGFHTFYDTIFGWVSRSSVSAYVLAGGLLAVGAILWSMLGQSLLPNFKEQDLMIGFEAKPGTSQPAMQRIMSAATKELRTISGVRNVAAQVGRAVGGDQVVGINSSQIWVHLDPTADYDAAVAAVKKKVAGYAELNGNVETYLRSTVRKAIGGSDDSLVVRVYGTNQEILRAKATEVKTALSVINGISELKIEEQIKEPHVEVKVDLAKAERYGLKPGDVRRAAATVFAGIQVGSLFEKQKIFDVVVFGSPEKRKGVADISNLLIDTPSGQYARLGDVADVKTVPTLSVIKRDTNSRRIDIVANVKGRGLEDVAADIAARLRDVKFPLEYHPVIMGEYAERLAAKKRMSGIAIAALIGIYLLLQAAFRSWSLSAAVFVTLPAALVGGLVAAYVTGGVLSIGSMVGLLAVFAIAVRHGISLVTRFHHLEHEEGVMFGAELVRRGVRDRFGPIMATTIGLALVLIPVVIFGDVAGLEIVQPMAIVVLGGLITATMYNLMILPALYSRFGAGSGRDLDDELDMEKGLKNATAS